MDTTFNSPEPMDNAKKWLSVGAGAAGFVLSLYFLVTYIRLSEDSLPMLMLVFVPVVAAWWAVTGTGLICRTGPRVLNKLPAPVLIGLGLILGGVAVIIGLICFALRLLAEIIVLS